MLVSTFTNTLVALVACGTTATATSHSSNFTTFKPNTIEPFFHIDLLVGIPTNATTVLGVLGRVPNRGGNVTGLVQGTILPVGAANELLPAGPDAVRSLYKNQFSINVTSVSPPEILLMNADATIQYANNALYGIASISFEADPAGAFANISYERFVGQVMGDFFTGDAVLDIFRLGVKGREDGGVIKALEPPGEVV
ncbi:hypothetical protein K402DRAFT_357189 [Aulographum hederae CBS 113979]|uniref:Uncharacterized protein n=1 Tax=Aulographum hederae CBS 113979 TaxID=1176131 RepID=A0A6G1GXZ2_9PEZI|nr:hypothetical protein K402DRAFT_357189 [Aulographum hederae CBS 113979]